MKRIIAYFLFFFPLSTIGQINDSCKCRILFGEWFNPYMLEYFNDSEVVYKFGRFNYEKLKKSSIDSIFKFENFISYPNENKYIVRENGDIGKKVNDVFYPVYSKLLFDINDTIIYYDLLKSSMNSPSDDIFQNVLWRNELIPIKKVKIDGVLNYIYDFTDPFYFKGNSDSLLRTNSYLKSIPKCLEINTNEVNCFMRYEMCVSYVNPNNVNDEYNRYIKYIPGRFNQHGKVIESYNCKEFLRKKFNRWESGNH